MYSSLTCLTAKITDQCSLHELAPLHRVARIRGHLGSLGPELNFSSPRRFSAFEKVERTPLSPCVDRFWTMLPLVRMFSVM